MKTKIFFLTLFLNSYLGWAQPGQYLEYTMSMAGNDNGYQISGTISMYNQDGNNRTESNFNLPGMDGFKQAHLTLKSNPDVIITLIDSEKKYIETPISKSEKGAKVEIISVEGNEKVGKYNCTHIKIKQDGMINDMWISKDVPGYSSIYVRSAYLTTDDLYSALKLKNIDGFPVKMVVSDKEAGNVIMMLTKAEQKTLDINLFVIPKGYTKHSVMTPSGMPDSEKIKNMTEEERQKYIEEMMKKMNQEHDDK